MDKCKYTINDITLKFNDESYADIKEEVEEMAQDILNIDYYNAMNEGANIDNIITDIQLYPLTVIKYLIDMVKELQD